LKANHTQQANGVPLKVHEAQSKDDPGGGVMRNVEGHVQVGT